MSQPVSSAKFNAAALRPTLVEMGSAVDGIVLRSGDRPCVWPLRPVCDNTVLMVFLRNDLYCVGWGVKLYSLTDG